MKRARRGRLHAVCSRVPEAQFYLASSRQERNGRTEAAKLPGTITLAAHWWNASIQFSQFAGGTDCVGATIQRPSIGPQGRAGLCRSHKGEPRTAQKA